MAEYKGLTIRIGGDTSSLNSALKASTKAAASLQSQIRQITRAMKFDPGNLGNIDTRMRLTTNRAEALYSKLTLVSNAYEELGKQAVSVGGAAKSVAELARETENIELKAKAADKRYEDVTASLAAMYREFEKLGTASIKNALNMEGADEEVDAVIAKFRELGIITRDVDKDVDRIKLDLSDAGRAADIDELLADMRTLGALTDEQIASNRKMRDTFNEALGNKDAYDKASQYEKMAVDMQRFESEAKNAAATVREMNTVSDYFADNWQESAARIKATESAMSECTRQAKAYEAALREDPDNVSAAVGRLKALSNEYDLAGDKARELTMQVEAYREKLAETIAKHRNLPQFIQETRDKWQEVQDQLSQAKGEADALEKSLQRLKDDQAPTEEIKDLESEVDDARAKVERLKESARGMDEAFETANECAEMQQLQAQLSETTAHAANLKKRMDLTSLGGKNLLNASTIKSAGMTLYSTLTPAITMLGWRAVTAAQDIDSAYRDMRKTVDGTESQFADLRQAAIDFSKTHVTSADQLLNIMAIGGELGIATESLQAFSETVSNLDVATNLDTEEAASSLGKLANITHMGADEYDNYADALVRLGNNGASTEDQIVDIATRIGSMGTIVGMSVPEILALSSSIASTGMKTEAAGTAIANTISDIESAVSNGGDALEAFGNVTQNVGMSAEQFAQTWKDKPVEAFEAFIKGLVAIEENGGSAVSTLEEMGMTGERQKQSILGLMQTIGGLDTNLEMSRHAWEGQSDAWGAAGDAAREASKKAEGFSGQLAILSNIGNDAMASLAEGATPIIAAFSGIAKSALDAFEDMDEGSKTIIVALLGIGAAIGPLMTMASTFVIAKQNLKAFVLESGAMSRAIAIMKAGFADAGNGASGMKTRLSALGTAAKTVGTSLAKNLAAGAVVAGITLAVAAISDYIKKLKEAEEAARGAGDVLNTAIGSASTNGGAVKSLAGSYDELVEKLAASNRKIQESANETYSNVALIEEYGEDLKAALDAYNSGDRSAESMANLKTALDLYNTAAGTSITFTQDETGALKLMKDGAELSADAFDRLSESIIAAAKAEFFKEGYTTKMGDYRAALDQVAAAERNVKAAEDELREAESTPGMAPERIDQLETSLASANKTLEDSKQKLGETTSAMNQYEEGMKLMTEAQLENAGAGVKWVAENDALQASIWANGQSVTEFAHNLDNLGIGMDALNEHSAGITEMAASWDGSMLSMINGLRNMGVEIDLSKAKIDGLNAVQIDGKTYWVDDMGTVFDQQGRVIGLKNEIGGIEGKDFVVTDNGTADASAGDVRNLASGIGQVNDKKVSVEARVSGASETWSLASAISNVVSKTVDVVTRVSKIESATGSIADSPYIPRHAAGYIAKGPTLTNNGWVGEAGAEAVLNWGTGGTVVPLTNTKYMEPIAAAIAKNMGGGSGTVNNYSLSVDGAIINDDPHVRMLFMELMLELQRKAAMNFG